MTTPPSAPLAYSVRAWTRADGTAGVRIGTNDVELDARWGEPPTGDPGPAELLASAFAACLLKNLARTRDLLGFQYDAATADVIARRQDSPPRFTEITYSVVISTRESPRRVALVHQNLRRFGTVYNTLAAVCEVRGDVVGRAPSGRGSAP